MELYCDIYVLVLSWIESAHIKLCHINTCTSKLGKFNVIINHFIKYCYDHILLSFQHTEDSFGMNRN